MAITDKGDTSNQSETIAPAPSQASPGTGSASTENYCPPEKPAKPSDDENKTAMKEYNREMAEWKLNIKMCANHLLREVRVEIQEVVRILDEHIAGNLDIKSHGQELDSSRDDIETRIKYFTDHYLSNLEPNDSYSEILNLWQMAQGSPYFEQSKRDELLGTDKTEQDRLHEINLLKKRFARLIFEIEFTTGKERINAWIAVARPGYALPFHRIFEDEIGSLEDRQRILNLYSMEPQSIRGGLVDSARGIILCYPLCVWNRIWRHATTLLILVFSFFLVDEMESVLSDGLGNALGIADNNDLSILLLLWTAMLVGIVGHVLVTGAKTTNVEFRQFPLPIRDWDYYLSARTAMLLYKIALSLFVFLSMFVLLKGKLAPMEAFLIGYSFDSVVELLGVSLEKRSAGNISAIKETLGKAA